MEKFEDILDKALFELRHGTAKEAIFSKWPQYRQELQDLLAVAEMFNSLPKNKIPEPAMQRKYLTLPVKSRAWFAWVHVSKFISISMGAMLLIAGFATTVYGAARSLPGATLFPLKKLAEQVQLGLASNDLERANIQLKITRERLADAQEVFSSPGASSQQQAAALNELASQTGAAVQTVQSAAAGSQDKTPLVASLNSLSSQQQALIKTITSADQNSSSATSTPPQAVASLMAATASEQAALIYLNKGTTVATTSTSSATTIVTATSTPTSTVPSVLSAATSTPTSTSSTSSDESNIPLPAPSQAIGTFIPESPAPQFQP